jgi:hypothetical protein
MLGHLTYELLLNSPTLAEVASKAAGDTLQKAGRHLASGAMDELTDRVRDWWPAATTAASPTTAASETPVLVSPVELGLLKDIAVLAARGDDCREALEGLRAWHQGRTKG